MSTINTNQETSQEVIPSTNVILRVKKAPEFKLSQAGNKMLVFTMEIAEPADITDANGVSIPIAGIELLSHLLIEGAGLFRFVEFNQALRDNGNDVPIDIEIDEDTGLPTNVEYAGLSCWAVIATESRDAKSGKGKDAATLLNPLTNKPQVNSSLAIKRFITAKS